MNIYYSDKTDTTALYDLWYNVFHDSKKFCDYYFTHKLIDNTVLAIQDHGELVSQVHLNPYQITFANRNIASYYIVGVCTKENYRGKGLVRELITKGLNDLYNAQCEFAFLTTVDEDLYTRYHFRYVSCCFEGKLTKVRSKLNLINPPTLLNTLIYKEFTDYYINKMLINYDGYILRDNDYISRIIKELECENGSIQIFYNNNKICGYIMLYLYEDTIQIRELFYEPCVLMDIIAYLQNVISDTKSIDFLLPCDLNLATLFQNYFVSTFKLKQYVMARLIYIKTFLEALTAKIPVQITIQITDSIVQQNNITLLWDISTTSSFITQTTLPADVTMDIGDLTQWVLGYIPLEALISLNKIKVKNNSVVQSLNLINIYHSLFINEVV